MGLNPKFTNFKPPSSKYTEGFSQAHKRWQGTPKHPHCQEYCCYHQLFSSSMSTLSESPPSSSSLWDHDLDENRLTCSVPLNLGGISALAQFVESHHCKRVTRVHLQLAHLMMMMMMMILMRMMMMMMMITVNSDALCGKTSTKR